MFYTYMNAIDDGLPLVETDCEECGSSVVISVWDGDLLCGECEVCGYWVSRGPREDL